MKFKFNKGDWVTYRDKTQIYIVVNGWHRQEMGQKVYTYYQVKKLHTDILFAINESDLSKISSVNVMSYKLENL